MDTILGYLAAFCTTLAFVPQALKVYTSKHTQDISIGMFSLMNIGIVLWLVYGFLITSYPIIIANAVTIIFSMYILITKIRLDVFSSDKNVDLR